MLSKHSKEIRFLDLAKPDISIAEAVQILKNLYGLNGVLKPLESERDLNFRVATPDHKFYLLKISNHLEPSENIDFEIAALNHIAASQEDLPVPRIQKSLRDFDSETAVSAIGHRHAVRLLSYLPGTALSDLPRTDELIFSQGKIAAQMAIALQGFFHPAAGSRQLLWDVRQVAHLKPVSEEIENPEIRTRILSIIDHFQTDIRPKLASLRGQIAHMDLSRFNMVADDSDLNCVSGILDFGDMHHGPLIQDIAVAIADVMYPEGEPLAKAKIFLHAYQHILPLQQKELDLLYDLLLIYLAVYYLILIHRGETYFAEDQQGVLELIEMLQKKGRRHLTEIFSQACGHSRPRGIAVGNVEALIECRKRVMGEPLYVFYDPPLNITRGDGVWLYSGNEQAYLDVYNNVPIAGHSHPYINQAITRQLDRVNTNTRYIGDEIIAYAERLNDSLPSTLNKVSFVNSGSEANDLAWLMAVAHTGNFGAIIIEDAYHGWTQAVAALSPSGKPDAPLASHVRSIPAPNVYRNLHETSEQLLAHLSVCVDQAIKSLAQAGMKPALCIVDSAFCSNGVLEPLPGYLPMVFEKVRQAGGLCVTDEVQSGFGRMGGDIWGFNLHKVEPDIITLGKPMANGYPMGAVITRADILASVSIGGVIFPSFGGNNVAAAAANAVLDVFYQEDLLQNSADLGVYLKNELQMMAKTHKLIGDVRGNGLILGVELVLDRQSKTPAPHKTDYLLQKMSDMGVLLGSDGPFGNVIKLRPPLVFNKDHADILLEKLDTVFKLMSKP